MVISMVVGGVLGFLSAVMPGTAFILNLATTVVSAVGSMGMLILGLVRAAGEPMKFGKFFKFMNRLPLVLLVVVPWSFFMGWAQNAGVPVLYWLLFLLTVPAAFWVCFVIDRDMGVFAAIGASFSLVGRNLGSYIGFLLLTAVVALPLVGLFALGFTAWYPGGLWLGGIITLVVFLWFVPFMSIVMGKMFAEAEGLQGEYGS